MIFKLQRVLIILFCIGILIPIYFLLNDSRETNYFKWFQGHTTDSTTIITLYDFGNSFSKSNFSGHHVILDSVESIKMYNNLYINKMHLKLDGNSKAYIQYKNSNNEIQTYKIKHPKDSFKIIAGSCIYQFQGLKKYLMPGNDWEIFNSMRNENADLMLWLGDNVYYRNKDFNSKEAKANKNLYVRNMISQDFLENSIHYSIWDDHDYGDNNSGFDNPNKTEAKFVFNLFWPNPEASTTNPNGIFYSFKQKNTSFFMLDSRWNQNKAKAEMLGRFQMNWLKNQLVNDTSQVKIIVCGTQILNEGEPKETFRKYKKEFFELMDFIIENNIRNVFFLSGDRHYSAIFHFKYKDRVFYELSTSPLLAFPNKIEKKPFGESNPQIEKGSLYCNQSFGSVLISNTSIQMKIHNNAGEALFSKDIFLQGNSF